MMLGIGLGIMAILCAVGLIAGGGLLMHREWKDKKDHPAMERSHNPGKTSEPAQGSLLGEEKDRAILWNPAEKAAGEENKQVAQQCPECD